MQTRLKIGMSFAGVAVFAAAIAAAPMLQHNPLLKWAIYLIGGALLSPLALAVFPGDGTSEAKQERELDPYSGNPADLRLDNPYREIGVNGESLQRHFD
ncbi:hypothetical protein [Ralstonia pickettii]|uniref:Transmembrane protein n=1 Tax=Ralstonia pickettii TaxID=329 RepID=A0AAW4Q679_RALPI|nr:hypothetical protein [Ralstonia pickettii]MBA9846776.1 hypothetical protein [Ralstonia pickettii]MBA9852072.1 hypothetical protein [Ralstonia pickettii]MBA9919913.1 hypothetical protein [Ralstonia pickettii]MBA9959015.1 hypothetical protein [Ralstonia pickettii]MBA9964606.1 hypothetical protein [Ralstonia pickettii]